MKKAAAIVVFVAVFILIVTGISIGFSGGKSYHAKSGFWIDPGPRLDGGYDPYFLEDQYVIVSNLFSRLDMREALAKRCDCQVSDFSFSGLSPVRGTRIIRIQFEGTDSNRVFNAASNANLMLISWYATNRPSYEVRYVDTLFFEPKTSLQIKLENLRGDITRLW